MYTFSPMMVANSRKHHCRVRSYTREVLVISTNLDIQKNHYPLDFRNRRGDEARIKNTWYNQGLVNEGDFNRLRIQDIKDMLLLLVQGKLTNLTVEEPLAFNVSLRMFTRSVVIQRRMENLQLGVESYQKKLNLTKPMTDRSEWSNLEKKRAHFMIKDINKLLKERRMMRSLEKFVGGRLYETDLRLLQRTI
ncbi:hypothetical protein Tco_1244247 [Tanacetum coccineum]